ncbi:PD-(D/E)XK nuclease family protein, partial [Candidatus Saccharibacteria bacterium]|nr:PD-(D/E)XK nuclease family protein [Candidatus Saccharibacteria bacterium]
ERLRLFFVALTRAEANLTITNSIKDYAGKTPARLEYLEEYENTEGQIISPFLPEKVVNLHYQDITSEQRLSATKTNWITAYQEIDGEIRAVLAKRLENYRLTATDLVTFIDIVYAGPLEFYKRKILRAPSEPATEALAFGNLIHNAFEAVTNQHLSDSEAVEFFKNKATEEAISSAELEQILERGVESLQISLTAFGDILRHQNARAEADFYHEHLLCDNVPITGKIDHINIDEKNKTIEVYDFKTGNYHADKWHSHATLLKYALQLGFYKLLLNNSPTYSKYQVTKAHILFVSLDPVDNKVYDKVYEYSEKDEIELRKLIQAIYQHVVTLDFLDNPELALAPDADRKLKDIKEFMLALIDENM